MSGAITRLCHFQVRWLQEQPLHGQDQIASFLTDLVISPDRSPNSTPEQSRPSRLCIQVVCSPEHVGGHTAAVTVRSWAVAVAMSCGDLGRVTASTRTAAINSTFRYHNRCSDAAFRFNFGGPCQAGRAPYCWAACLPALSSSAEKVGSVHCTFLPTLLISHQSARYYVGSNPGLLVP